MPITTDNEQKLKNAIKSVLQGLVLAFTGELCNEKDMSLAVDMIYDGVEMASNIES